MRDTITRRERLVVALEGEWGLSMRVASVLLAEAPLDWRRGSRSPSSTRTGFAMGASDGPWSAPAETGWCLRVVVIEVTSCSAAWPADCFL